MSTPVDLNIAMPYGVTVVGDGTNNPKLVAPHPRQLQNFGLKLPPGPCRIAASWEGDEKVGVVVQTSGTRNYRTVGNIPERSGGGCSSRDVHRRGGRKRLRVPQRVPAPVGNEGHLGGLPAQLRVTHHTKAVV